MNEFDQGVCSPEMEEGKYRDGHWSGEGNRGHGRKGKDEKGGKLQMDVCPQHLRFTQDSISNKFKPPFEYIRIIDAVYQIRTKVLSPTQMPPLNVVKHKDILWSLDNRRLWIFRKAGVEEITVNLVPRNFSPRSYEFFTNLNADLEKIYSSPTYYPRVRGGLGKIYVKKSTPSELSSIRNCASKEEGLYRFEKEDEGGKLGNLSCPDLVNCTEITAAVDGSSFPEPSSEPEEAMPTSSISVVPKPITHHSVIDMRNPDGYVLLPSSEKEAVSENVVIGFMKMILHGLSFGAIKVFRFCYEKGVLRLCKFLHGMFKGK